MDGCEWLQESDEPEFLKLFRWLRGTVHIPREAFVGLPDEQRTQAFFCYQLGAEKASIRAHGGRGHITSHHITSHQHVCERVWSVCGACVERVRERV